MNRKAIVAIVTAVIVAIGLCAVSFAQPAAEDEPMMGKGMMKGGLMMKGQMPNMMGQMMQKSMVATSDGGVIVLAGNKLFKYDKDLNLIKEVEIKVDMKAMHKDMMEMMKDCPMMKEGVMEQGSEAKEGQ
ncbi:MAG: hypothetical protein JW847_07670 [Candidatus Omnitrophica bacterium]|nr:hypothetical protein [Candidatus Omnitrophota bacterium]